MRIAMFSMVFVLAAAPAQARDESVYQLATPLVDHHGAHVSLDVYRGHPTLVSMFYGTCPAACPLLTAKVLAVDAMLDAVTKSETRVLLVSFDPKRDTPSALSKLAQAHGLDEKRMSLAATTAAKARELGAALQIHYRALPDGAFEHDSKIVVLDRNGAITGTFDAFDSPVEEIAAAVRAARASNATVARDR